jgi:hypothetical protein
MFRWLSRFQTPRKPESTLQRGLFWESRTSRVCIGFPHTKLPGRSVSSPGNAATGISTWVRCRPPEVPQILQPLTAGLPWKPHRQELLDPTCGGALLAFFG